MSDFYKYFKENMDDRADRTTGKLVWDAGARHLDNQHHPCLHRQVRHKSHRDGNRRRGHAIGAIGRPGALGAAYYAGAAIGSLAAATGRTISGGTSLGDVLFEASRWGFGRPWLTSLFHRRPGIYDPSVSGRKYYKLYENYK